LGKGFEGLLAFGDAWWRVFADLTEGGGHLVQELGLLVGGLVCMVEGGTMSSSSWIWVRMSPMVAGGYVVCVKSCSFQRVDVKLGFQAAGLACLI